MEDENVTKNSVKIIKINQNLQKNNKELPNFEQKLKNNDYYVKLSDTQKFKYTLNYVIKLLKAKKISVEDALDLLMNFV